MEPFYLDEYQKSFSSNKYSPNSMKWNFKVHKFELII